MNNLDLIERYKEHTDKYFLRAKKILQKKNINPIVRYQVFAREDRDKLIGIKEAVDFIMNRYLLDARSSMRVFALEEGSKYKAGEPILKIEGFVQDLIDLETVYLSILSGNNTPHLDMLVVEKNAKDIVKAAQDKPVWYFGARHFASDWDEHICEVCKDAGFAGCSTDIGAKAWGTKGIGTIPHALIIADAAYIDEEGIEEFSTLRMARAFDEIIEKEVPRIILIDTFNREQQETFRVAREMESLEGIRIDTCGENFTQGTDKFLLPNFGLNPKYIKGRGVTITGVWALRTFLDREGFPDLKITVSSGFNADKTKAFMDADRIFKRMYKKPLFDSIGTGSVAKSFSTTSDIVAYYNKKLKGWIKLSKVGRKEVESNRLKEIK